MTSLASLVDPTLVERLGWTLVHSLWQGVLIAAVSGILFFALRNARAQTRYLAACASLLLVVASAAITFSMIAPAAQAAAPTAALRQTASHRRPLGRCDQRPTRRRRSRITRIAAHHVMHRHRRPRHRRRPHHRR